MRSKFKILPVLVAALMIGALFTAGFSDNIDKEQKAGTEGGTTKRYIDMSNPWTGAYLHEDMKIEGKAEVKESFQMGSPDSGVNIEAGVGEEGGTKAASVEDNSSSGEKDNPEPKTENNSSQDENNNPGSSDNIDDAAKAGEKEQEEKNYLFAPVPVPGWEELF